MSAPTIDYRHRPAKNIERHFIVEMSRRLMLRYPKLDFQYVGFGAFEFLDFQLMHRQLGIDRMSSIEKRDTRRAEFNKPFKSIQIIPSPSRDAIVNGEVDLDRPTILWLDYTTRLTQDILGDVVEVGRRLKSPSFFLASFNASPDTDSVREKDGTLIVNPWTKALVRDVGSKYVPSDMDDTKLGGRDFARLQRTLFDAEIRNALTGRREDLAWFQTLNLHYKDGLLMQTVGGLLLPTSTLSADVATMMRKLEYFRSGDDYLNLRVPVITPRERAELDKQLPKKSANPLRLDSINPKDVADYRAIYRYLHMSGLQSAAETTWTE